jgi:hypothetical protein
MAIAIGRQHDSPTLGCDDRCANQTLSPLIDVFSPGNIFLKKVSIFFLLDITGD